MMNLKYALIYSIAAQAALHALPVAAQDIGQHPAVFAPRRLPAIDPSTFIVAHPAQLGFLAGHANHMHPAVAAKAAAAVIDTDAYRVQPPATTRWTLGGAEPAEVQQLAQRATLLR
jgi:hypothetical protein